ncbi:hypothetical protein Ciccas_005851 [Cichlidogyrus casuarinus]|uniref:Uncharacterized protein n=1 Tax=Cichlidogyrus casuarinus TaxID=1844966 RepID=A0ABD2Q7G7_9PLAT
MLYQFIIPTQPQRKCSSSAEAPLNVEAGDLPKSSALKPRSSTLKKNTDTSHRKSGSMGYLNEPYLDEDDGNAPIFGSIMRRLKSQKNKKRSSEGTVLPSSGLLSGRLALVGPSSHLAGMAAGLSKWQDDDPKTDITEIAAQAQSTVFRGATGVTSGTSSPNSRSPSCSLSTNSAKVPNDEIQILANTNPLSSGDPAQFATPLSTALAGTGQGGRFISPSQRRSVAISGTNNTRLFNLFKSRKKRFRSLGADKLNYLDNIDSMDFDAISNEGYLKILQDEPRKS